MVRKALVHGDRVLNVIEAGDEFKPPRGTKVITVQGPVNKGWRYNEASGNFLPPMDPMEAEREATKLAARLSVLSRVKADEFDDETVARLAPVSWMKRRSRQARCTDGTERLWRSSRATRHNWTGLQTSIRLSTSCTGVQRPNRSHGSSRPERTMPMTSARRSCTSIRRTEARLKPTRPNRVAILGGGKK